MLTRFRWVEPEAQKRRRRLTVAGGRRAQEESDWNLFLTLCRMGLLVQGVRYAWSVSSLVRVTPSAQGPARRMIRNHLLGSMRTPLR